MQARKLATHLAAKYNTKANSGGDLSMNKQWMHLLPGVALCVVMAIVALGIQVIEEH
jgi:hypothetical protein